ncbi:undecaprenyl-diphosphate phosphatase [Synechococcus sp. BSF8S]|uniref:undecaprenyl-diphosphate phosphatase n=1 Tax=Synechococcales TaxID=1890424 RepID=UPI001629441F|nr:MULTISPECIES: undecaprenyl-diphosphate phosphatase [unclassified Synechococcus]MBC1262176.1 undecaprenyl-diphosphate phosphatase [Synechococcus sp. BSF8S]MBC1265103.1 undecaprenyl-diphosphate phosphatase [Synechococcus sp. BSA11S]MCT0249406.1 undecaprenyl-diphosphate phosphatase [Synechococcus sp. CS-205]
MGPALSTPVPGFLEACWHALVLGIVQGLTEFLPISSTAHLKVVPVLLGWGDPGVAVTAVIQLGSIAAVLVYFRQDLAEVLAGVSRAFRQGQWGDPSARLGLAMAIGTLPIVLAGLAIKTLWPDYEQSALRGIVSIALVSIVMALLLAAAERVGRRRRDLPQVRPIDGLLVGIAQALAVIPGVSRSGSTLTASLFDGWQRAAAARFSFLLGIPAITLAGLVELKSAFTEGASLGPVPLLIGIASAALVSWLAIAWLLRFLQTHSTWIFVIYRLVFGLVLLLWVWRMGPAAT